MEKLEIIINELMANGGPTPMNLGNVGAHDAKTTQSDPGYEQRHVMRRRVCHRLEGVQGPAKWHRGKGADEWTSGW